LPATLTLTGFSHGLLSILGSHLAYTFAEVFPEIVT